MKSKKKKKYVLSVKKIFKEPEIEAIKEYTNNPKDKAFLKFISDSGTRIREALAMRVGDINFIVNPPLATITGKTD